MKMCSLCNVVPACKRSKYGYCWGCRYKKLSQERFGINNPNWKGDRVGYTGMHDYIKWHKPMPKNCELCKQPKNILDLANISQKYLRDLSDWEWLCRSCHMAKDGRMANFIANRKALIDRVCRICGNRFKGTINSVRCSAECRTEANRQASRKYKIKCNMKRRNP